MTVINKEKRKPITIARFTINISAVWIEKEKVNVEKVVSKDKLQFIRIANPKVKCRFCFFTFNKVFVFLLFLFSLRKVHTLLLSSSHKKFVAKAKLISASF